MDKRILEFCFSVPDTVYISDGRDRMLIRRAMKGLLPDDVLWNTKRGLQAADLTSRMDTELDNWKALIQSFCDNNTIRDILDCRKLEQYMNIFPGKRSYKNMFAIVTRGAMVGYWLKDMK